MGQAKSDYVRQRGKWGNLNIICLGLGLGEGAGSGYPKTCIMAILYRPLLVSQKTNWQLSSFA